MTALLEGILRRPFAGSLELGGDLLGGEFVELVGHHLGAVWKAVEKWDSMHSCTSSNENGGSVVATFDVYGSTDKLDDTTLDAIAMRLEARGDNAFFIQMLHEYLDEMNIDTAATVLDVGCGTGVATRAVARRPGFDGYVTGIDLSSYLCDAASRLANDEGLSNVEFRAGDSRSLQLADASFDAVVLHTLVSHVDDPLAVVNEAARVVKPGGMIGVFDGDYASLTFGHADPEQGKRFDEIVMNAIITRPRVMRQMPRLLREAGLELIASKPYVLSEIGEADFWMSSIESLERLIPASGALPAEEAVAWAAGLKRDSKDGVFFGSSNYYSYVASRPA